MMLAQRKWMNMKGSDCLFLGSKVIVSFSRCSFFKDSSLRSSVVSFHFFPVVH